MHIGWIGAGLLFTGGLVIGGARTFVDSQAGPGTSKAATNYGVTGAAEFWGGLAQLPASAANEMRQPFADLANQAGSLASGVGGTTATTAAGEYGSAPSGGAQP